MGELSIMNFTDTEFKDGDDGGGGVCTSILISEVQNGYIIAHMDDEGDFTYVFNNGADVLEHLKPFLGVNSADKNKE